MQVLKILKIVKKGWVGYEDFNYHIAPKPKPKPNCVANSYQQFLMGLGGVFFTFDFSLIRIID